MDDIKESDSKEYQKIKHYLCENYSFFKYCYQSYSTMELTKYKGFKIYGITKDSFLNFCNEIRVSGVTDKFLLEIFEESTIGKYSSQN